MNRKQARIVKKQKNGLIALGIAQGQARMTASRAQRICLECVGFD